MKSRVAAGRRTRSVLSAAAMFGLPAWAIVADTAAPGHAPEPPTVRTVLLDPADPPRSRVGRLIWRGGVQIIHADPRFGGLSGLHVSADGRWMTAVTDRGAWVTARLNYREGDLTGIDRIEVGDLKGRYSDHLPGSWRDAEALSPDGSGGFFVAFERRHRIWRYPPHGRGHALAGRPMVLDGPAEVEAQPHNGGIETLTRLCDGRLLAISEQKRASPGSYRGWIGTGRAWSRLAYASKDLFQPTDAATLPDCDVAVLERYYNVLSGVQARLVRLSARSIRPGTTLAGEELAVLAPPLTVDNFEGLAARRGDSGESLLYLVSDDNFSGLQRTLLLMFALPPDG